jgi:hypothetical protein
MANENNTRVEETTSSGPYEIEREIPFHADESAGWAQPPTSEKPAIARVNHA